jgi:GH15 family glucan-1,4-alpha-glucosidase
MAGRIEDYALVGDLQTGALVGTDGSIDWLCLPHFDSPACFAALLGDEDNGHWRIAPAAGGSCTRRQYRGDTFVLETVWELPEGTVRVVDCMPPRGEAPDLVRVVEGIRGRVPMHGVLRLRFDYGRVVPWVRRVNGQVAAIAGPDSAWLSTPAPLDGRDLATHSEFAVSAGERVPFVLTWHPSWERTPRPVEPYAAVDETEAWWAEWMARSDYDGAWQGEVRRSLLVLKALTFQPTGGIVAAPTTSLPEQIGGPRNWDYRFCWLRDAALTLQALLGAGFKAEAGRWRDWLLRAVAGDPADLQIMYGITGARRIPELELDWLSGYEGSRPVRIGNAAAGQLQLDVWGETLDGLSFSREANLSRNDDAWALQMNLLEFLEGNWQRPDNGLWEMRGARQHFVHSKVMAWVAFDRMIAGVEHFRLDGPVDRWRQTRKQIRDEVLEKGYDADRNTFTQAYGSAELDAALLLIPQVRFLPWDDPRVSGTVDAVQRELCSDGFVRRYQPGRGSSDDGLPGDEGAFLACSFWLTDALHGIGRHDDATAMFDKLIALANDVGLLAEEYDVRAGRQVGNTPQAFSHLALINAARHLSGAHSAAPGLRQPRMGARRRSR